MDKSALNTLSMPKTRMNELFALAEKRDGLFTSQGARSMPVTTVERSILDVIATSHRADSAWQAIADALRTGLLNPAQASALRKRITRMAHELSLSIYARRGKANESSTRGD
jgi:hypothetical protein